MSNPGTLAFGTQVQEPSSTSPDVCRGAGCPKPGTLKCSRCRLTRYCSKECQKADWTTRHKYECSDPNKKPTPRPGNDGGDGKKNCFLIRAAPQVSEAAAVDPLIEPIHLSSYGMEAVEVAELRQKLGWKGGVGEVGKFYDHAGSDTWYYFCYGRFKDRSSRLLEGGQKMIVGGETLLLNGLASMMCGTNVYGDVAVIRSGPAGPDAEPYAEEYLREDLIETAKWYLETKPSASAVFANREKSRYSRKMGLGNRLKDVPGIRIHG